MVSPVTVGTAIVAVPKNLNRASIRIQNVGTTTIYLSKTIVSATDYELTLAPPTGSEVNEAFFETKSTDAINLISSAAGGKVAIFETNYTYVR